MRKAFLLLFTCFSTLVFSCHPAGFSNIKSGVKVIGKCCSNISAVTLKMSSLPVEEIDEAGSGDNETSLLPAYSWNAKMNIR